MPKGLSSRSRQRRYALRILFEIDINKSLLEEVLEGKSKVGEEAPRDFTLELVRGVEKHRSELDRIISEYAEGWDLERMPLVDRNILRMSLYELFYIDDIPSGVTIDEAVELAKSFSTEDSGKFVNGVLGKVNRDREEGKQL
ncbi:MAG: transcription antitermination factor NusB [Actinobacteria bacterium]|nr:transcription antitermination factor NusB [Actinomycetota bacterium]